MVSTNLLEETHHCDLLERGDVVSQVGKGTEPVNHSRHALAKKQGMEFFLQPGEDVLDLVAHMLLDTQGKHVTKNILARGITRDIGQVGKIARLSSSSLDFISILFKTLEGKEKQKE
jgi:hypothetical protein